MKQKILSFLLLGGVIFVFFGCEKKNDTELSNIKSINIFAYQFDNEKNNVQVMADAYMAIHPDIRITVEEYPWNAYWENVEVRFGAEDPNIDIVVMDIPSMAGFSDRGFIEDLTKYIPGNEFTSKVPDGTLNAITYKGGIMAAPLQNSDQYLYINKDMAEAAGVVLPSVYADENSQITESYAEEWGKGGWTWEEVVDAAMKMTKDVDSDGIIDIAGLHIEQGGRLYQLQPLGGSRGGKIVSPDGETVKGYFDQEVWVEAVQFYSDLFNKYKVEDPGSFLPGRDEGALFLDGKFAMLLGGGWHLKTIIESKTSNINVVMAAHPYFKDGKATTPTGSWITGIGKKTSDEKKEIAADFLQWWTLSEEGTSLWYDTNGELPATRYMLDQLANNTKYDDFPQSVQRLGVYQVLNTAEGRPVTPFFTFINSGFDKAFIDAAQGKDARTSLMDAVAEIEKEIGRVK